MSEPHRDEHSGVETTGHEWDGIRELDNPLPRWWLWVFYATIAFSIVYWVLMPAWPGITSVAPVSRSSTLMRHEPYRITSSCVCGPRSLT